MTRHRSVLGFALCVSSCEKGRVRMRIRNRNAIFGKEERGFGLSWGLVVLGLGHVLGAFGF